MCSISGIISNPVNRNKIYQMINIQKHRAPDSSGVFNDENIAIGMGRLKIIDLKSKNLNPILGNRYVLAYNGEIYNYKELKSELLSLGKKFSTTSDSEVLLKCWEQWGTNLFSKLNGMYAFCIYDKLKKKIYLARDIPGEKPLYYYFNGKDFLFSSEAKAISKIVDLKPNKDKDFFNSFQYCLDKTLWKNLNQLKPAHYLTYDMNTKKINTYEYWSFKKRKIYKKDIQEELEFLLKDSLRIRLRSDVKLGIYYSGGVDSSLLNKLHKFDYKFHFNDNKDYLQDFKKRINKIVYHLDFPVGSLSSYPLYSLASRATKKVKVIISGEGADELFGGYVRYLPLSLRHQLSDKFPSYKLMFNRIQKEDYCKMYTKIILKNNNFSLGEKLFKPIFEKFDDPVNAMGYVDFKFIMPSLLQMGDRMASAFGIENRCPYLDKRLIEFAFSLPPEEKIDNFFQKKPLRNLLIKKKLFAPAYKEKKGLVFNFKKWHSKKDLFREKYFNTINKIWMNSNHQTK